MDKTVVLLLSAILVSSCSHKQQGFFDDPSEKTLNLESFIKSDIDSVLEIQVYQVRQILRELMIKLYKRNPKQLKYSPFQDIDTNVSRLFDTYHDWKFKQLDYKTSIEVLELTFDEEYQGDKVFSFMVGLSSMLMHSYGNKIEFFLLDTINAQSLYNSARNIEIAVWKLSNDKNSHGEPFLYTNSLPHEEQNLSYERLWGKLIAIQDTTTKIMQSQDKRLLKKILQRIPNAFFLPL